MMEIDPAALTCKAFICVDAQGNCNYVLLYSFTVCTPISGPVGHNQLVSGHQRWFLAGCRFIELFFFIWLDVMGTPEETGGICRGVMVQL